MPNCAVINFPNTTRVVGVGHRGVTFHCFPNDPHIKNKWIEATGRKDWLPRKFIQAFKMYTGVLIEFQQQHAKILHANPKYVESVKIFTTRHGRKSPYVTDLNITLLEFWGNKFNTKIMFYKHKERSQALIIEAKTCDLLKLKWAKEWMEKYSNMSAACPVKPGHYRFVRFEIPPKNIPLPIGRGDYETSFSVYLTKTKEIILELIMSIKFDFRTLK